MFLLVAGLMIPTCKITPERANIASRVALRLYYTFVRPRDAQRAFGKSMQNFQSEINN